VHTPHWGMHLSLVFYAPNSVSSPTGLNAGEIDGFTVIEAS
jgi:hypothetical protein